MRLDDIIRNSGCTVTAGNPHAEVRSVCNDSRKVVPGALFVAVKGFAVDGHAYIATAVEKGAAVIVYEDAGALESVAGSDVTMVKAVSSRYALAIIAANFYDNPSEKLTLVGITGTNGKTTTVTLLHRMFTAMGYSCGLLSTIANYVGTKGTEAVNTTSDPLTINSLLAEMVEAGCGYCFMEVSSIGVEQDRVAGLKFKAGIFSNLTHDHLDYHKTFAEYLRCKKLFFDTLPSDAYAITNVDDRNGLVMVQNTKAEVVTYSLRSIADHTCRVMEQSFEGMLLKIDSIEAWSALIGLHNAYNLLAIYTTAVVLGADPEEVLVAMSTLKPASGRLENIRGPKDISVIIDYAHTPDALENAIKALRPHTKAKLNILFGCGGDRDAGKRPIMGKIANDLADEVYITDDNPRTEDPSLIREQILTACPKGKNIPDRAKAIKTAISELKSGDILILAGKGHETGQYVMGKVLPFSDHEECQKALAQISQDN